MLLLKTENLAHVKREESDITRFPNILMNEGEAICIFGKSGSGKGLLLKLAAGLLKPEWGSSKQANVAKSYVFGENGLLNNYMVYENLIIPAMFSSFQESSEHTVMAALEKFKLLNIQNNVVGNLPEAPKRLIQYARAEVLQPKLLFIEEPLKSVRDEHHPLIKNWLASFIKEKRGACLFTSTSSECAEHISATIIELSGGDKTIKTFIAE